MNARLGKVLLDALQIRPGTRLLPLVLLKTNHLRRDDANIGTPKSRFGQITIYMVIRSAPEGGWSNDSHF